MKVLVLGSEGQLGRALASSAPSGVSVISAARSEADLAIPGEVGSLIATVGPHAVINAAAFTAVDRAEADREIAFRINRDAVAEAARACQDIQARFYHVSTDYVFDGQSSRPYRVDDRPKPLNVYGESKLAGERALTECSGLHWATFRTAWVYGAHGRNFLLTMLRLLNEKRSARVVDDQFGAPTHARSLARVLWRAVGDLDVQGVWHFTDAGSASWYDFAEAVREEASMLSLVPEDTRVVPVPSSEFATVARRPPFSVLDRAETWRWLGGPADHWRVELRRALEELAR